MSTAPKPLGADGRAAPRNGETRTMRHQASEPRLPHERDESSDSQAGAVDKRMAQAARDVEAGMKDTGLGPVVAKIKAEHFPATGKGQHPKS